MKRIITYAKYREINFDIFHYLERIQMTTCILKYVASFVFIFQTVLQSIFFLIFLIDLLNRAFFPLHIRWKGNFSPLTRKVKFRCLLFWLNFEKLVGSRISQHPLLWTFSFFVIMNEAYVSLCVIICLRNLSFLAETLIL